MTTTNTNKPVDTIRFGRISASIWENQSSKGTFYNFTLERGYVDAGGQLKSTKGFGLDDALTVAKLADMAHTRIIELLRARHAETTEQTEEVPLN